jgi:hypothetical protein
MEEGARVHPSGGSNAPTTYGSYEPRRANPSTGHRGGLPDISCARTALLWNRDQPRCRGAGSNPAAPVETEKGNRRGAKTAAFWTAVWVRARAAAAWGKYLIIQPLIQILIQTSI